MSAGDALAAIKTRAEGHSRGPWDHEPYSKMIFGVSGNVYDADGERIATEVADADGALFAAVPRLLAALEAVEALTASWEAQATGMSREDCTLRAAVTQLHTAIEEALS